MTASDSRRGLFLDFDGTVAESLGVLRSVYDGFLASFGHAGEDAEFAALNGPPLAEVVERLRAARGLPGDSTALLARYEGMIDAAHDGVGIAEGAEALMRRAAEQGWIVAIVSSNSTRRIGAWLDRAGLHSLVSTVVGGGEAARGKPFPDPYLLALERTGCDAASSLAVEDAPQGARAAAGAGLRVFGLDRGRGASSGWPGGSILVPDLATVAARLDSFSSL